MRAEHPQITLLDEGLYGFSVKVSLIVINILDLFSSQQRVDLFIIKACQPYVVARLLKIQQQRCQGLILPFADRFVQRDVQRLLFLRILYVNYNAVDLRRAFRYQYLVPLMAADDIARDLVPDQWVNVAVFV